MPGTGRAGGLLRSCCRWRWRHFTGGLNLALVYAAPEDGGEGWRDTQLRVEGPGAANDRRSDRSYIRAAYLDAIARAEKRVWITNAYFRLCPSGKKSKVLRRPRGAMKRAKHESDAGRAGAGRTPAPALHRTLRVEQSA